MAEQIIREYILITDQFKAAIKGITKDMDNTKKTAEELEKEFQDSFNKGSEGAKRFNEEVKKQPKTIAELELRLVKLKEILRDDTKIGAEGFKRVSAEIKKTQVELDKANGKFNETGNSIKRTTQQAQAAGSQFTSLTNTIKNVGIAIGVAFGAQELIRFTTDAIKAASDLGGTTAKAGELFVASLGELEKWAEGASQSIGQSKQQALDAASTFAIFGRAVGKSGGDLVGFSTQLTELSSDLASFNNTTPEEAVLAIGAALRGESEPIRRYGVLLDEATLRQKGFELGIISSTKQALTPQQRVLAAQAAIFEQTAAAQGDFSRTSDQLANQQRILAAEGSNLQAKLGQELLPVTLQVVKLFNALATGDLPNAREAFIQVNDALSPLKNGLGGIISLIDNLEKGARFIINGEFREGLERLGEAAVDFLSVSNPLVGAFRLIGESLFETTDDLKNAELEYSAVSQGVTAILARQNQIYADLAASKITDKEATEQLKNTNIALDVIYKNVSSQINITREQFDKYVAKIKEKTKATDLDNDKDKNKLTLLQRLQAELTAINARITDTVLKGGIVSQSDITRAAELEKILRELPLLINAIKTGVPDIVPDVDLSEDELKALEANLQRGTQVRNKSAEEDLQNAQDYLDKKLNAEIDYNLEREQLERDYNDFLNQQRQQQFQNAQDVLSVIGNTISNIGGLINQVYDQQQQAISDTLQAEINAVNASTLSEEGKQAKISALQKKAAKDEYELQVKAFKVNQGLQIANAAISTAQAVVAGLAAGLAAGGPAGIALGPITAALAGAVGAVQIGLIAAQQPPAPPAFAKGTEFVQRGNNKPGIDTIPAYLNEGEAVIPTDKNKQYPGLAKAWIGGKLESYVNNVMLAPKLAEIERKAEERMMSKIMQIQGEKYDDMRMYMATTEGNMYLRSIAKAVNQTSGKKRGYNA